MSLRLALCRGLCAFFVAFLSLHVNAQQAKSAPLFVLDGPSESPEAQYIQEVLELAYEQLGYRIAYQPLSIADSFIEANTGRIDGLRGRIGNVEKSFINLIKIPEPLLDFEMVLMADRRRCGACELKWVKQIAVVKGFRAFEDYRAKLDFPLEVVYVTHSKEAFELVVQGKVAGAIMSNTNVPEAYYSMNHHWIKSTLATLPDYHYINKKHAELAPKLTQFLADLKNSGELQRLQQKHGVKQVSKLDQISNFGAITATTASWFGYSDTPQGTYYKILDAIYGDITSNIDVNVVNWKRAKQNFYDNKADILVGAYDFEAGEKGTRSDIHLDYEFPVTAYAKDPTQLARILSGEKPGTACYLLGYSLQEVLPESVSSYESPTIDNCMRLLSSGRVDILLDYEIDLPLDFVNSHSQAQVLEGFPLFMVFQNTQRGNQLKQIFEVRLRKMLQSGKLKTLFPNSKEFQSANFVPTKTKRL